MKINLRLLFISLIVFSQVAALSSDVSKKQSADNDVSDQYKKVLVIDKFDDADIKAAPAWWTFDAIKLTFPEAKKDANGYYYLKIKGKATNYYVGGMGTYLGKEAADYDHVVISIMGNGEGSGVVRLQLYDDDNNTYQLEQDSTYQVLKDDYLEYEVKVDWKGWRTIEIPIAKFVDMNQGVGDDIWNPSQKDGSGGLLHFQYVILAASESGTVDLAIDNIKLVKKD